MATDRVASMARQNRPVARRVARLVAPAAPVESRSGSHVGHVDAFVTYDDRLAAAARGLGLPVVRPD